MNQRKTVAIDDGSIKIDQQQNEVTLTFTVVGSFTPSTLSKLDKAAFTCIQSRLRLHGGYAAERWRLVAAGDCARISAIMRATRASVECNLKERKREITLANNLF